MVKGALCAAIGFAAISSIALAEDLSSATAPLASRDIHDTNSFATGNDAPSRTIPIHV
jgi:hypothetical protein